MSFETNLGGSTGALSWGLLDSTVGGENGIPEFAVSTSCTPAPLPPPSSDLNQNPIFVVRTSYDCAVSFTPQSGSDRRDISKNFAFTTDSGQLLITVASARSGHLQNNTNIGGFSFNNEDSRPVTITGLTIRISFNGISTSTGLTDIRFENPATGSPLHDLALASLDGTSAADVTVPLSFTIPAHTQKMLPTDAIGVSILHVSGTYPTITVSLRSATTDTGIPTKIVSGNLSWTCTVSDAAYNPYATSSPFLSGDECGQ